MTADTWKLQDAKARFSEVVRLARAGEPQRVTVHGEEAVVIVDPKRFDISPKTAAVTAETVSAKPAAKAAAKPPAPAEAVPPEMPQAKPAEVPRSKPVETLAPVAEVPKPVAPLRRPAAVIPKVEKAPEPVPVPAPTPDAAALDLIAELELELRRLKEPLPEAPRRRFGDESK